MVRASGPWVALFALYAVAILALDASDPATQVPLALQRLRDATSTAVAELVLAAFASAAYGFGAALARRWVPDPWATWGVAAVAVSPLGFAMSSGVRPGAVAAALLAAGILLALRVRDHPSRPRTLGAAACLALAPFFGLAYGAAAAPVLAAVVYWTYRRGRPLLGLVAIEIGGATAVTLIGLDQPEGRAATPGDGAARLAALLVDRGVGVLRWAPVLALAFAGAYLLARSRQEHLARAIPARRDAEVAAMLTGLALLGMVGAAAFGPVGPDAGLPLAGALGAWGLRRYPRAGGLLVLITVAGTVWVAVDVAAGAAEGWLGLGSDAPWGPLVRAFPRF